MRSANIRKWYNSAIIESIGRLYLIDPIIAMKEYEDYLEEYPNDYVAWSIYLKSLTELNRYEEAENVFKHIKASLIGKPNFHKTDGDRSLKMADARMCYATLKIIINQEQYSKALNYLARNWNAICEIDPHPQKCAFYLKEKLNIPSVKPEDSEEKYLYSQIQEYDHEKFLEHIKGHMISEDVPTYAGVFYEDFPINKVIDEIKRLIPNEKCLGRGLISDYYVFRYDNNGRSGYGENYTYRNSNFFEVITLRNTNELITMYPVHYMFNHFHTDLNYLKEEEMIESNQIEKFNSRYGR